MTTQLETFLQEINDAFARGDYAFFAANVADDVHWEMVGDSVTEGKAALMASFQPSAAAASPAAPPEITVNSIITHGNRAAVEGTMRWAGESGKLKNYAFCDVYTMSGFKDPKIRAVKSFVIELNEQNGG
jgi:ketosteroid isomerase-like protein